MSEPEDYASEFVAEWMRARQKHPPPTDIYRMLAVITEEVGELNQAVLQADHEARDRDRIKTEAVQVGAMALRLLLWLDGEDEID